MSDSFTETDAGPAGPGGASGEPSEEDLRRAYEAELERITVGEVVLQTAVSLVNLGGMRLGLGGGPAAATRDLDQARDAIDAVRGLMPVLERQGGQHVRAIRDALSQLQFAYTREAAADGPAPEAATPAGDAAPAPSQPPAPAKEAPDGQRHQGPAESSGRLWVPGRR